MNENEFKSFSEMCYSEFDKKQENLMDKYDLNSYGEYWFDMPSKTLQFKNNGEVKLEFETISIGTWSSKYNTWSWVWANDSFPYKIRKDSECIKELYNKTGLDIFLEPALECEMDMAIGFTALSLHQLNALGSYKIPGNELSLFLALIKEKK